ncbi:MAG: MFS transporter [Actinomycetota bacterium]|nr:MFS transporter [Actinomycetota bacterium]
MEQAGQRSRGPLLLLESATLLSGAGNGAAAVVLPWLVLERTGSAGSAGLLAAATALPLLVSSVFSGTIVDRIGRRRTAVGSDVLSACSVAAIPLLDALVGIDLFWLIVLAVVGAVFDPAGVTARETMLPATAARAGWPLERVNGVHEAVWGVAFLVGPGVGGVLIAAVGAADALWVTAAGFTLSALLVALLRVPDAGTPTTDDVPESLWRGTVEGVRYVARDPLLRGLTAMTAVIVSVYMPIEGVLLPVHFEAEGQPGRLGAVIMAMSLGGIVGALGYGAISGRIRRSWAFRGALIGTAAFLLVLAALPPYAVMLAAAVGIGISYGPVGPILNLAMQTRTTEAMRGRVVGIITSAEYAAGPVGYLIVGATTQRFGVRPTLLVVAVLIALLAVAGLFIRSLGALDGLRDPAAHGSLPELLDEATAGPVPLVLPPRDPDHRVRSIDRP